MQTERDGIPEVVVRVVARALGGHPRVGEIALHPPLDHQSNRLYDVWMDGRHLIAKEFVQPGEVPAAPAREFRALQLLAPLDVAPRPVFYDPALGPVVVYDYLEGDVWDRRKPTAEELSSLAELWLRVNGATIDGPEHVAGYESWLFESWASLVGILRGYQEWTEARFPPGKGAANHCLDLADGRHLLVQSLARGTAFRCFSRSDPRFANVLRRPDRRLGMVDWEDSGVHDPMGDVADMMVHANQEDLLTPSEWRAFLQPYLSARRPFDPDAADRLREYLGSLPLLWLAILIREGMRRASQGALAGWTVNGLPANQRLRRYLARALAWPDLDFEDQLAGLAEVTFFP